MLQSCCALSVSPFVSSLRSVIEEVIKIAILAVKASVFVLHKTCITRYNRIVEIRLKSNVINLRTLCLSMTR